MKYSILLFIATFSLVNGWAPFAGATLRAEEAGPVVVELFTSEGCSSCPPADRAILDLVKKHEETGAPVFCLAFHVDYWNDLGWKDRFSEPEYTARQKRYAKQLKSKSIYTPQAVINGASHVVGSRRSELQAKISAATKTKAAAQISLRAENQSGDWKLYYRVATEAANQKDAVIHFAVVQRRQSTDVVRGENAGKKLIHANVVRSFNTRSLQDDLSGKVDLSIPPDTKVDNIAVIALVQKSGSSRIIGVNEVLLKPE